MSFWDLELVIHRVGNRMQIIRLRRRRYPVRIKILNENGKELRMFTINADKKRVFTIKPVDKKGRPASLDLSSVPEWEVDPEGGVELFPSSDGMSCDVVWIAPKTGMVLTVRGDADMGDGVRNITGTADLETLTAEAASFELGASEEVDADA